MIIDNEKYFSRLHALLDVLVITFSYICAWVLRFQGPFAASAVVTKSFRQFMFLLIFIIPGYLLLYQAFSLYTPLRMQGRRLVLGNVVKANTLGLLVIISSPAAWSRAADGGIVVNLGLSQLFSTRSLIFSEKMWRFVTPVLALVIGVVALFTSRGRSAARHGIWGYVFISMALMMFALGLISERAYAPLATVALIIIVSVADRLLSRWQRIRIAVVLAALALTVFTWARGIIVLRQYEAYNDQTVSEVVKAPRQAVLHERQFEGYSRFIKPMNYMSTNFFAHGVVYSAYYDKENVQFVNDSIYERYHSGRLLDGAYTLPVVSDPPEIVDSVLEIAGQDYMAVVLHCDTVPYTFQTARYYIAPEATGMTEREMKRRTDYGLVTDYNPRGFFPLRYQGRTLLIFPLIDRHTSHVVFPVALGSRAPEVTLTPAYHTE